MLGIFDTHAHYDSDDFDDDREILLANLPESGVEYAVNIGANLGGCQASVDLAKQYPHMYATVGVHPDEVGNLNEETFAWLQTLLEQEKVVGIGEIGLDYYWDKEGHDIQKKWFIEQ